jgi:hypothetical protein
LAGSMEVDGVGVCVSMHIPYGITLVYNELAMQLHP